MSNWKRNIIYLIIIASVGSNAYVKWKKAIDHDREVAYLSTNNIRVVFTVIESLNRDLVVKEKHLTINQEDLIDKISDATDYVIYSNKSLNTLYELNDNFNLEFFELEWFLRYLKDRVIEGERLTSEEVEFLGALNEVRLANRDVGTLSNYSYIHGPFEEMRLPANTNALFTEIERLLSPYNLAHY